jgi:hypothetical protein
MSDTSWSSATSLNAEPAVVTETTAKATKNFKTQRDVFGTRYGYYNAVAYQESTLRSRTRQSQTADNYTCSCSECENAQGSTGSSSSSSSCSCSCSCSSCCSSRPVDGASDSSCENCSLCQEERRREKLQRLLSEQATLPLSAETVRDGGETLQLLQLRFPTPMETEPSGPQPQRAAQSQIEEPYSGGPDGVSAALYSATMPGTAVQPVAGQAAMSTAPPVVGMGGHQQSLDEQWIAEQLRLAHQQVVAANQTPGEGTTAGHRHVQLMESESQTESSPIRSDFVLVDAGTECIAQIDGQSPIPVITEEAIRLAAGQMVAKTILNSLEEAEAQKRSSIEELGFELLSERMGQLTSVLSMLRQSHELKASMAMASVEFSRKESELRGLCDALQSERNFLSAQQSLLAHQLAEMAERKVLEREEQLVREALNDSMSISIRGMFQELAAAETRQLRSELVRIQELLAEERHQSELKTKELQYKLLKALTFSRAEVVAPNGGMEAPTPGSSSSISGQTFKPQHTSQRYFSDPFEPIHKRFLRVHNESVETLKRKSTLS